MTSHSSPRSAKKSLHPHATTQVGWADVNTRTDLEHLRAATTANTDGRRAETKARSLVIPSVSIPCFPRGCCKLKAAHQRRRTVAGDPRCHVRHRQRRTTHRRVSAHPSDVHLLRMEGPRLPLDVERASHQSQGALSAMRVLSTPPRTGRCTSRTGPAVSRRSALRSGTPAARAPPGSVARGEIRHDGPEPRRRRSSRPRHPGP